MNIETHPKEVGSDEKIAAFVPATVHINTYFPTQIFTFQLPEPNAEMLNDELMQAVRAERRSDAEGLERSNFRALGGWHSKNFLHEKDKFAPLVSLVERVGATISEECGYHAQTTLRIGTMWAIINTPGSANKAHVHPGCLWSGVYYIQAPKNSGNIEFTDPRTANIMAPVRFAEGTTKPQEMWTKVNFEPVPGKLIIFPSWLYHSVAPNLSTEKGEDGERVIISFNLFQGPI